MNLGAVGVVSVASNIIPAQIAALVKAMIEENENRLDEACHMLVQNYEAKQRMNKEDGIFEE